MHVRTYGHHGFGSKLFDGELSEKTILDFLSKLAIGDWTPANNLPIIGYLDGIKLKPSKIDEGRMQQGSFSGTKEIDLTCPFVLTVYFRPEV